MKIVDFFVQRKNYLILFFTLAYSLVFTVNAFTQANYEFLYYTFLMAVLIYVIVIITKRLQLAFFILLNLSLLGFFHLLGGNYYSEGLRLYDHTYAYGLLHYDNIIHTYGTFIATLTLYSMIADFIDERLRRQYPFFALGLVLMALGVGTIVELVEFFAVITLGVAEQVGGYFNNSLDLFFNTVGSILATIIIYFYRERARILQKINEKFGKNN